MTSSHLIYFFAVVDLELAADGFPEIGKGLNKPIPVRAVAARAGFVEQLPNLDAQVALVLPDRSLAVDDVEHLPAPVMAHPQHADGRLQLVQGALKIGDGIGLDLFQPAAFGRGEVMDDLVLGLLGRLLKRVHVSLLRTEHTPGR